MNSREELKYFKGYPKQITDQITALVSGNRLSSYLLKKYPSTHEIRSDKALYDYTMQLKNKYLKKSQLLHKVIYDNKIKRSEKALGLHTFASRVQGKKLKASNEIRIASLFKDCPEAFLPMIVAHELAHLKEKEHNKAFYKLCTHIEPDYHQIDFDTRLYLTHLDIFGELY